MTKLFPRALGAFGLTLLLFTLAPAQAASTTDYGPRLNLATGQTLTGRFVHEHPVQGFDKPIRSEGHFKVTPPSNILWAIERPMATTTTITREGLVQSVGDYPLLNIPAAKMPFLAEVQDKLLLALNGDWKTLERDYTIKRAKEGAGWVVTISPRTKDGVPKPFQKIVAHGAKYVDQAEVVLPNGTTDRLVFSDQAIAKP